MILKKILITLIIIILNMPLIKSNNHNWDDVIDAIASVESNYDEKIVSSCGRFVGYLQISKILIDDCNKIANYNKFKYDDRFNKDKSIEIFIFFQSHYNPENDIEKAIRMWKGGTSYTLASTEKYYKKVKSRIKH